MEVVASIIGAAVTETCRSLFGFYPSIKSFIRFKSNLRALDKERKTLLDLSNRVIQDVDFSDAQMTQWLREVEKIMLEVDSVQAGMTANKQKLCGCFFDSSKRYRLGKEIARMLKDVERLVKEGNIVAKMLRRMAKAVEHIPGPSIENQTTASKNLAKVMDLLNDDDVKRIGVWGMGGVGKTTLVKNLNNKLKDTSSTLPFDIMIWATVSQKLDSRKVQIQIAERLNLYVKVEESQENLVRRLHRRLQMKKFLLILDDVWGTIDLDSLGVPQPEHVSGSKIILTSRSLEVCRKMKTDKQVKVDVLNDEESWQLFTENAGEVATSEHIEPIARKVAAECGGLPLAIITVGKAMRGKTRIELWNDALSELESADVPDIEDVEKEIFKPLKLSYDSLQGKNIKSCFLYCSLYPEDFSIDANELVKCWLGEGLINGQKIYEDSCNRGMALIEKLKDSCLLEHGDYKGTVKMHDIVRNVAIWISSSLEDGCKAIVRSGIGLAQISDSEISTSLKRVSFMHNNITELPDYGICCPETISLLLQGNRPLKKIPDEFLQASQLLRVLNLSDTGIQLLPQSILELGDLRVLLLRNCSCLEELSQLGGLSKLEVLDCSGTSITKLPSNMKNLRNLRQLYLFQTFRLKTIQSGIVSSLSGLEVLDMGRSAYVWGVEQQAVQEQATFRELLGLKHLLVLSIILKDNPDFGPMEPTWICRFMRFQFVTYPFPTVFWQAEPDGKRVTIFGVDVLSCKTKPLLINATSVVLDFCELKLQFLTLAREPTDCFVGLKSLTISNSIWWDLPRDNASTLDLPRDNASTLDLLPNLEELHLLEVQGVESISKLTDSLGLTLSRLRLIEVTKCSQLRFLFQYSNGKLNTEKLEVIKVSFCNNLCELFQHTAGRTKAPGSPVPNLRIIQVKNCKALRELPLRDLNPSTIQEIRWDEVWWNKLEQGSDEDTKIRLQHVFKPVKDAKPQLERTLTQPLEPIRGWEKRRTMKLHKIQTRDIVRLFL